PGNLRRRGGVGGVRDVDARLQLGRHNRRLIPTLDELLVKKEPCRWIPKLYEIPVRSSSHWTPEILADRSVVERRSPGPTIRAARPMPSASVTLLPRAS